MQDQARVVIMLQTEDQFATASQAAKRFGVKHVTVVSSSGPSAADIEATVEVRVELAKASLVAPTAAPLSTYTPLPTPTLTPAPVVEAKETPVAVVVEVRRTL